MNVVNFQFPKSVEEETLHSRTEETHSQTSDRLDYCMELRKLLRCDIIADLKAICISVKLMESRQKL